MHLPFARSESSRRFSGLWPALAAALVPVALLAGLYAAQGVAPFGPNSLFFGDMDGQYSHFLASFSELFGRGLFYTWHKALGGEALSWAAYYLFSPFNFLVLLFPTSQMPTAVTLITLAKAGCAGLSMQLFLRRRAGGWLSVPFSWAWALSGYLLGFSQNIMWMDALIALPLIAWGIRRILEGRSPWLYLASLAAGIFCCYYIGWMLCLYSLLYFLFGLAAGDAAGRKLRVAVRFALASLLAGGLNAWMLLPVAKALGQGKAQAAMEWGFSTNFSLPQLLGQLFAGAYPAGQDTNTLPLIFCGTLPLVLAALFFFRPGALRPKLASGGLLVCLLLSFWLRTPDLVWHGFQSPSWFNYRYSFLFIFTLLELAALGGKGLAEHLPAVRRFASAGAVALLLACAWGLGLISGWAAVLTLCCLAAAALLLAMPWRRAAGLLAAFCLAAELTANGWSALEAFEPFPSTLPRLTEQWQSTVEQLSAQDPSARMQLAEGGQNTPFLLDYNGLSHYSSSYSQTAYELMRALGCTGTSGWMAWSDGLTQSAASLLGLRWQLGGTASGQWQQQGDVWENPCALPLVVAAADTESERLALDRPFDNLNQVYNTLLGEDAGILHPIEAEPQVLGLEAGADGLHYTVTGENAALRFSLTAPVSGVLYASFPVYDQYCGADVLVNGEAVGQTLLQQENGTICLGQVQAGQTLTVELRPQGDFLSLGGWSFAVEDSQALATACERLQQQGLQVDQFAPGLVRGTIQVPEGCTTLFTSIPAEPGWQVLVDGKETEPGTGWGALLCVPVAPGERQITLRFTLAGLGAGAAVSLCSLGAAAAWLAARRLGHTAQKAPRGGQKTL
ncbi:YfhO family protein [Fournierella sp.]|uniref:YfhO family protein n=1 Tax=Allofournierella sp. TaxID=1940256 RepID=UPI00307965CE